MRLEDTLNTLNDDLATIINTIKTECVKLYYELNYPNNYDVYKHIDKKNASGDEVLALDQEATIRFITSLEKTKTYAIATEETEEVYLANNEGRYSIVLDPLDGSDNLQYGVTTGTIFGIYKRKFDTPEQDILCRTGRELVASGYILYGVPLTLVLAIDDKVTIYTYGTHGTYDYFFNTLKILDKNHSPTLKYYSVNHGNHKNWDSDTKKRVRDLQKKYTLRYIGSLVADFHRNLLGGGVFYYPHDKKNPNGKLRLLFEAIPLAKIIETVNGYALGLDDPILDVLPEHVHQKTPLFLSTFS